MRVSSGHAYWKGLRITYDRANFLGIGENPWENPDAVRIDVSSVEIVDRDEWEEFLINEHIPIDRAPDDVLPEYDWRR